MFIRYGALLLSLLALLNGVAAGAEPAAPPKAVLVTGASTGIGRSLVERLSAAGYFVYAGARKPEDLKALAGLRNVQPLALDVTKQADIDAAVATVTRAGRGLYGLVNNAGIVTVGTVAGTSEAEFDLLMRVNVYGPVKMTRAFAPLIVAAKGRITNIGSIAGILAGPELSAYTMSKHALEAFTDSLAAELGPQGVEVNIVEPGNYDSAIEKSAIERGKASSPSFDAKKLDLNPDRSMFKPPAEVAAVIEQALFEPNPRRRYMIVPNAEEAERTIKKQLRQLVQLNEGQAYTYDRAALVAMLDELLAKSRPKTK